MGKIKLLNPVLMQHPDCLDNWILTQDFWYDEHGERKKIPRGFVTDLASIPKIFWNLISPWELGDTGPLKHDWRYRNGIDGTQKDADDGLMEDMKADNVPKWKRDLAYAMLREFGRSSWNSRSAVIEELEEVNAAT
jgi:hypothetical protein